MNIDNCQFFNGAYTGIGVIFDVIFTDDALSLVFSNGAIAGLFILIKS